MIYMLTVSFSNTFATGNIITSFEQADVLADLPECEMVQSSIVDGVYPNGTQVSLSTDTDNAQIYYEINSDGEMLYQAPITIDKNMTIRAWAVCVGHTVSEEVFFGFKLGKDTYEPNDVIEQATNISINENISSIISRVGDTDFYTFTLPVVTRLRLTFQQPLPDDELIILFKYKLYDSLGNIIDISGENGNVDITRYLAKGDYYIQISSDFFEYSANQYNIRVETLAHEEYDFSEYNLVNSVFNPDSPYHFYNRNILSAGAVYTSVAGLSRWQGYLNEEQDPYVLYYDPEYEIVDRNISNYNPAEESYRLQDAVMLPPRKDFSDNAQYKNAIYTYGGLYCGIVEYPDYYNQNKTYFYHPEGVEGGSGHAITLIGWDDTIPKENFTVNIDGTQYTPPIDGAFLAKNSYGTQTGEDGYFYISYCTANFSNNPASAMIATPRGEENVVYTHDIYGYTGFIDNKTPISAKEIWAKNVFAGTSDQTLKAISYYATGVNQSYDIFIQTATKTLHVASGINAQSGYYTVGINDFPISVGETFAVIIYQTNLSGENVILAVEHRVDHYSSNATAQEGQSYISLDGNNWQDISKELSANNCIKVYAHDKNAIDSVIIATDTVQMPILSQLPSVNIQTDSIQTMPAPRTQESLPISFDLRNFGAVSSVKDQGNPPTCWTFATMASTESILLKASSEFNSGVQLSLDNTTQIVYVGENAQVTANIAGEGTNPNVYWQFKGDLDNIEIINRVSVSGSKSVLFTAKGQGQIVATATSVADETKKETIVFDIKEKPQETTPVSPTRPSQPSAPSEQTDSRLQEHTQSEEYTDKTKEYTVYKLSEKEDGSLEFTISGDILDFVGVNVQGVFLLEDDYTLSVDQDNNITVTIDASYLSTLPLGTYTLQIHYTDGYAEGTFTIEDVEPSKSTITELPAKTNTNSQHLWKYIIIGAVAGGVVLAVVIKKRLK